MVRKSGPKFLKNPLLLKSAAIVVVAGIFLTLHKSSEQGFSVFSSSLPDFSEWAVDQKNAGSSIPRYGHSLFDKIALTEENGKLVYKVPFPFTELVKKINTFIIPSSPGAPTFQGVHFPLGRSLQRDVANPDFFKSPRISTFVDGLPNPQNGNLYLRDRFYIGYQPKANALEIISYNDIAGRFEFQVVHDYREGGKPELHYADRALCVSCHQNQAPIFPRQFWDETNANKRIYNKLVENIGKPDFHGIPLYIPSGTDLPYQFEQATDRANYFSYYQKLWQEGCDTVGCLKATLMLVLQYRLNGDQFNAQWAGYESQFKPSMVNAWATKWPKGIAIPLNLIKNRDPLDPIYSVDFSLDDSSIDERVKVELKEKIAFNGNNMNKIAKDYEPLMPRPPLDPIAMVTSDDTSEMNNVITGLSEFFTDFEIQNIDNRIYQIATSKNANATTYQADCKYEKADESAQAFRIKISCKPAASNDAAYSLSLASFRVVNQKVESGAIERLITKKQTDACRTEFQQGTDPFCGVVSNLLLKGSFERSTDGTMKFNLQPYKKTTVELHGRASSAEVITQLQITFPAGSADGRGKVLSVDDLSALKDAITANQAIVPQKAFQRPLILQGIYSQLGITNTKFIDEATMPPGTLAEIAVNREGEVPVTRAVADRCIKCHNGMLGLKLNYMKPNRQIDINVINGCAQRIYFRLNMWKDLDAAHPRLKGGMPPLPELTNLGLTPQQWVSDPTNYKVIYDYVESKVREQGMDFEQIYKMVKDGNYDALPKCWN